MSDSLAFSSLTASEKGKLRSELLWELSRMIQRYNGGTGDSIQVEKAEAILESMLYCVRVYLESTPAAEKELHTVSGGELFRRGLGKVENMVAEAQILYREAVNTRIPTDLISYNITLDEAVPGFFKTYNPQFAAHENGALTGSLEYPLLRNGRSRGGILYIKEYLEEMKKENEFCSRYKKNYIRAVLLLHGKKHGLDYREMVVNIPELLLEQERKKAPGTKSAGARQGEKEN